MLLITRKRVCILWAVLFNNAVKDYIALVIGRGKKGWLNDWMDGWRKEWMNEWMHKWMNKYIASMERHWWENWSTWIKTCSSIIFFTINPTWTNLGMNPSLHSESTVTNGLCDVMAHSLYSSPNGQSDKINDKKEKNRWYILQVLRKIRMPHKNLIRKHQ